MIDYVRHQFARRALTVGVLVGVSLLGLLIIITSPAVATSATAGAEFMAMSNAIRVPRTAQNVGVSERCGYWEAYDTAWYRHCDTPPRTDIIIKIDKVWARDQKLCVSPGLWRIGYSWDVRNAWYTGQLCWRG